MLQHRSEPIVTQSHDFFGLLLVNLEESSKLVPTSCENDLQKVSNYSKKNIVGWM